MFLKKGGLLVGIIHAPFQLLRIYDASRMHMNLANHGVLPVVNKAGAVWLWVFCRTSQIEGFANPKFCWRKTFCWNVWRSVWFRVRWTSEFVRESKLIQYVIPSRKTAQTLKALKRCLHPQKKRNVIFQFPIFYISGHSYDFFPRKLTPV